jgi:hypothetical protein
MARQPADFFARQAPWLKCKKSEVGGVLMYAMVVGAVLALILIGLPMAIIGLFIMSIVDRMPLPERLSRRAGSEPKVAAPHLVPSSATPASAPNKLYASLLPSASSTHRDG